MADPIEVLDFWLGEVGAEGWYSGGEALDADCRAGFSEVWQAAADGGLEHWVDGAVGTLAYLVICDQLARNMHRGDAKSFATDAQARAAARKAVDHGWDMEAPEPERQFFYLPFMHSEDPADQALCVALFTDKIPGVTRQSMPAPIRKSSPALAVSRFAIRLWAGSVRRKRNSLWRTGHMVQSFAPSRPAMQPMHRPTPAPVLLEKRK
jgi:uncharacterized protein (DUF924 family)